jgi:hypothetical protein
MQVKIAGRGGMEPVTTSEALYQLSYTGVLSSVTTGRIVSKVRHARNLFTTYAL